MEHANSSNQSSSSDDQVSKSNANSQGEALKQYFAKRVTDQVRLLISLWRLISQESWSMQRWEDLTQANLKLIRYATHFKEDAHLRIAKEISQLLNSVTNPTKPPSSDKVALLSDRIHTLSQTALRRSDQSSGHNPQIVPHKPIYIALCDKELAAKVSQQLEFFGFRTMICATLESFNEHMSNRHPIVIIMDTNFGSRFHQGIKTLETIQAELEQKIPTIFFSDSEGDIHTLLNASRAGGVFFNRINVELSTVVEQVDQLTDLSPSPPHRVLIVEDSATQANRLEQILNSANMITRAITDPMLILDALEDFRPEIILMDMYMPFCTGIELANVIRQQKDFVSTPIIFLSAEENPEIQLDAIRRGGDDFLTKPVEPDHLITLVRAKGERARLLNSLMHQDSLTNLLNHTSILKALEHETQRALDNKTPLCFSMLDIDHFKKINDTYGHPTGDRVIKSLSLFLKQRLRKSDLIGRYGGEEFAVILPNTTVGDAVRIFNEIRHRFSQLKQSSPPHLDFQVTFSCGVAAMTEENQETLSTIADEALYMAKEGGRNQVYSK